MSFKRSSPSRAFDFAHQDVKYKWYGSKVSIIMPAYNVGSLILDTISSVVNQKYQDWELLIIDDNSTDATMSVLTKIIEEHHNIHLFSNARNMGAGYSRNVGIENAKGRFIAFLDSDDIWSEDKLLLQVNHMINNDAAISHTSFSFIDFNGEPRPGGVNASPLVDLSRHLKNTEIGTSTAIIDRRHVGDFRFSLIRARQDLKLWIDLLSKGYISYGLDQNLVQYRVRRGSVSSNKIKMLFVTLFIYIQIPHISVAQRIACYISYLISALSKRRGG